MMTKLRMLKVTGCCADWVEIIFADNDDDDDRDDDFECTDVPCDELEVRNRSSLRKEEDDDDDGDDIELDIASSRVWTRYLK